MNRLKTPSFATCRPATGSSSNRRGSFIVEIIVCTVLLSVVASILVPGIRALSRQRKATRFDTLALIELNNLAAKVRNLKQDEVDLTAAFRSRYPDATFSLTAKEQDEQIGLPAVTVTLSKPAGEALPDVSHSLTIWLEPEVSAPAEDDASDKSSGDTEPAAEEQQ